MDARPTRLLVVDDSALYRQTLQNVLRDLPGVTVVGIARDGADALRKLEELDPDLLTLDVQMPGMTGIEVLREIHRRGHRAKALMVSSFTTEGAQVTTDALLEGAFDFILKPSGGDPAENRHRLGEELRDKIGIFRHSTRGRRPGPATPERPDEPGESVPTAGSECRAVFIGVSTGGPAALRVVLPKLPAGMGVPVLVVQHMPATYTSSLARRLGESCELPVSEAADGAAVDPDTILIAPGGRQMKLVAQGEKVLVRLTDDPPENGCRPAVDYLFRSAAEVYGGGALAVIMTGMGRDGAAGSRELKSRGCGIFAQDEGSSAVYGMPKAVIEEGLADRVLPLGKIAPAILRHVKRSRRAER